MEPARRRSVTSLGPHGKPYEEITRFRTSARSLPSSHDHARGGEAAFSSHGLVGGFHPADQRPPAQALDGLREIVSAHRQVLHGAALDFRLPASPRRHGGEQDGAVHPTISAVRSKLPRFAIWMQSRMSRNGASPAWRRPEGPNPEWRKQTGLPQRQLLMVALGASRSISRSRLYHRHAAARAASTRNWPPRRAGSHAHRRTRPRSGLPGRHCGRRW